MKTPVVLLLASVLVPCVAQGAAPVPSAVNDRGYNPGISPFLDEAVAALAEDGGSFGRIEGQRILVDGVAAHVNEHVITIGDVKAMLQPVQRRLSNTYEGDELQAKLRKAYGEALNALIKRYLILDSYEKQEGKIPEWVIDERIDGIIHDMFQGDRTEFLAALSKDRLTFDEWQNEMRQRIIVSFMRTFRIEQNVSVSPKAVHEAYDGNLERYRVPEKVKLRMIVLRKGGSRENEALKRRQAEDIRKRLAAGEDFAGLAKNLSEGSRAADGGDWAWIEPGILRPELAKVASELKPAEISEVIETKEELYILKIEQRRNESVAHFEDVQPQIERKLRQEEAERLYESWIDRLKKDAYIKVFDVQLF